MTRKAQPKLVRFEDGMYWLVAKLAAEKSGLSKPELERRAIAGSIRFIANANGKPEWYAQPDIEPLREAHLTKIMAKKPVKARTKTLQQLEKEWANKPEKPYANEPQERIPESRRGNKPMLWRMLSKPKKVL